MLKPNMRFGSKFFKPRNESFYDFFVYGWIREEIYIYIGKSSTGFHRFFNHHIFDEYRVWPNDSADVWICDDQKQMDELERKLIRQLHPLLNKRHVFRERERFHLKEGKTKIFVPEIKITKPKLPTIVKPEIVKSSKIKVVREFPIPIEELGSCMNLREYLQIKKKYRKVIEK